MFFLKELPTQEMLQNYHDRYPEMDMCAVDGALRLLRRGSLLMRELEAYFVNNGLSQTRFLTMVMIDRQPEQRGLLPSEIADRLDVSRPVVTDTIKALERTGMLKSMQVAEDGRAKRVFLTSKGDAVLAHLLPGYFTLIAKFMAGCARATLQASQTPMRTMCSVPTMHGSQQFAKVWPPDAEPG